MRYGWHMASKHWQLGMGSQDWNSTRREEEGNDVKSAPPVLPPPKKGTKYGSPKQHKNKSHAEASWKEKMTSGHIPGRRRKKGGGDPYFWAM